MKKKVSNIREFVWKIIETDISIKKDLGRGLINVRGLANYMIENQKIDASLDSVISAIRRYNIMPQAKDDNYSVYSILKQARINTKTKMASLFLKRTDEVKTKLGRPDRIIDYQGHETIRILEGSQALTLVIDRKNLEKMQDLFSKRVILGVNKNVGMIEINYHKLLKKTPGVFSVIYNELAENSISIVDALISSEEHILLVDEDKLLKAFELIYNLCN